MTLRQYLITMILATILCWVATVLVIINVDPFESTMVGFLFFYTSIFLSLFGTVSVCSFTVLRLLGRHSDVPLFVYVQRSFYIGALIAFVIDLLLVMQSAGILNMFNVSIVMTLCILVLMFLFSVHKATSHAR